MSRATMQVLGEAFLLWRRYCQARLKPVGVSLKQAFILRQLTVRDLHPSQIAELLFTDRASTSVILKTMQRRGWVSSRRNQANRKFVVVELTDEGRRKLKEVDAFEQTLPDRENPLSSFSSNEKQELNRLALKLRSRMNDLQPVFMEETENEPHTANAPRFAIDSRELH
ncbi:MarR family winged helix-turn-helix transcriptional regulator [Candidatus Bipolaricaulota bacterium]